MKSVSLIEAVAFDLPTRNPDGYGGSESGWGEIHACRAEFLYSRGSEAVDAARLQGRSIYKVRIRQCADARQVTTGCRMRDVRRGEEYQVREVDNISDRLFIYVVVERGVAV
ncbi:phage head completion protein [Pukyongiella litopenaei]|uniref:Head-tail adaptor protein n=1 Tax=Pukyongiella litopenaei TaxID=2605946 RepID=A0A2S0MLG0_9RHOB|nr:head-tail adaptor protein [Pukyongiella litopenaei]AVO36601.1 head-tail adaptor protein [Pukyongiella litopenaei]